MLASITTTDCCPKALSIRGSGEDGVLTVSVGSGSCGSDGSSNLKTLEVQPDLTDVGVGPADSQTAG